MTDETEVAGVGHNSDSIQSFAADRLKSFIERVERLSEEKAALAADITEVFSEAKGTGFDVKTMRAIIKLRAMDKQDREAQQAMLDLYAKALGLD